MYPIVIIDPFPNFRNLFALNVWALWPKLASFNNIFIFSTSNVCVIRQLFNTFPCFPLIQFLVIIFWSLSPCLDFFKNFLRLTGGPLKAEASTIHLLYYSQGSFVWESIWPKYHLHTSFKIYMINIKPCVDFVHNVKLNNLLDSKMGINQ